MRNSRTDVQIRRSERVEASRFYKEQYSRGHDSNENGKVKTDKYRYVSQKTVCSQREIYRIWNGRVLS